MAVTAIWAEKYRPKSVSDYIFSDSKLQSAFDEWKTAKVFPNLILGGIQGTGKSSLARVLINEFDIDPSDYRFIDGSVHTGVDAIRDKAVAFSDIAPMGDFKLVIIEESHKMSDSAQKALLETIERRFSNVRFIFTTNFPQKLDAALASRCQTFIFNKFNEDGVYDLLDRVINNEMPDLPPEDLPVVEDHIRAFAPDIRAIISSLQYSYIGGRLLPPNNSIKSSSVESWDALWATPAGTPIYDQLIDLCSLVDTNNYEVFYTSIYMNGLHHFGEKRGSAVVRISEQLSKAMSATTQGIHSIHMEALIHLLFNYLE